MSVKIAPSILSADFARLAEAVEAAEAGGADWVHVDVMDGHFVPNLTIGPPVVRALRRETELPLDVHLMIERPDRLLEPFAEAGADVLTVHQEVAPHLHRTVQRIRELGVEAGVAVNPATPVETLAEILPSVQLVLIMSVNPGFGGQAFIETSPQKIERLHALVEQAAGAAVEIEVDGGVSPETAPAVVGAGATVLVAGSAVYGGGRDEVGRRIAALRRSAAALESNRPSR